MIRQRSHSKYHAKPTIVDNLRFASQKEARRYQELKLLLKAGLIEKLTLQPYFILYAHLNVKDFSIETEPGIRSVGEYIADFSYIENGIEVVEDVKSPATRTPLYKLKKRIAEACHGITIREV